jgi:aspartyl-tRNA(Asn)/glutamyl-tRNA(Gln) amidotransferase subunit B
MEFQPVIGLEVHAQLKTNSKIFCGCSAAFGAPPNSHTCPVCLGMPGSLPVLNRKVVDYALRMALALDCRVNRENRFARKNYFYPDLPKGYQISQYEIPIAEHGHIDIEAGGKTRRVGVTRVHMEEDAGKLTHDPGRGRSLVDFNRTGVPLIEIVSEPDIRSPEEAGVYLRELRMILRHLGICDGNMEEGSFRCDANISLRPKGEKTLGTRTELKNINSFKHIEKALHYEIRRQAGVLAEGGKIVRETLLWDAAKNRAASMRGKEEAHDYRYFPDPDLVPLIIDKDMLAASEKEIPELPGPRMRRFEEAFSFSREDARRLVSEKELADFFEGCLESLNDPKHLKNWIMGPLLGLLNARGKTIGDLPVSPEGFAALVRFVADGEVGAAPARDVLEEMAGTGADPGTVIKEKGMAQVTDSSAISNLADDILSRFQKEAAEYKKGKTKLLGFFVGQAMKETRGKADPKIVSQAIREKLEKS